MHGQFTTIFVVCSAAALLVSGKNATDNLQRIINGSNTTLAHAPYMVQLRDDIGNVWCGGSLVTREHVVTAAHCLDFLDVQAFYIVVGGANTSRDAGQKRRIVDYHVPVQYTRDTFDKDVAILKLDSPMTGDHIRTIPLCSRPLQTGDTFQVSGWGRTVPYGNVSVPLRSLQVLAISKQECGNTFGGLTSTMICGLVPNAGPCQYDSGGPGVRNNELCAIVSWGVETCKYGTDVPAVYTNVAEVREFIENAIKL